LIPHSRPTLTEEDALRVAAVVRSGQLAQAAEVAAFEREVALRLGVARAAATSSGTAALELALRVLGVGAGDEVVIPTYVCDALHHAVTRVGARPVLADACAETLSVESQEVKRRLSRRTRCAIVPHAFGLAAGSRSSRTAPRPSARSTTGARSARAATWPSARSTRPRCSRRARGGWWRAPPG
jgi:dTDP-4-amino-4,6-dideoxygalactose transaminase